MDGHPEPCGAAIHVLKILFAAKSLNYSLGTFASIRNVHGGFTRILPPRCFEVELFDQEGEGKVIDEEPRNTDHRHHEPVGFRVTLEHPNQQKVNETARERLAVRNLKDMGKHERHSVQKGMQHIEHRSDKQKRKFNRFCDTGQKGGESSLAIFLMSKLHFLFRGIR